jgi:3-deoxy-D-manno-octulosonic-acid transferase
LSARSARGYRRLGGLARRMLGSLRWVACQYPDHARRFVELGIEPQRVLTHGSVKFDLALPPDHPARVAALRARWLPGDAPVWIAGSTHAGEDEQVLAAHRRLLARFGRLRLVLVPRHPARAVAVAAAARAAGFRVVRQSESLPEGARADVLVGDVMGELLYLYGLADVAFVGGSLVRVGGHNPIEPAACGVPVVTGPHVENFPDVIAAFRQRDCLRIVTGAADLADVVGGWLADPAARAVAAAAARTVVAEQSGATARLRTLLLREIAAVADAHGAGVAVAGAAGDVQRPTA